MEAITSAAALEFTHVSKWFAKSIVLQDISFNVAPREKIVICGPSGSGKSTLLRCINGLETYQQGKIQVAGITVNSENKDIDLIRRDVGICFQQFNLFPHLNVLDNCTLGLIWVKHLSKTAAIAIAREYLQRVKMLEYETKYPHQLSGGQQQRVAIARSLCMSPKIMLFDEPTSALDPEMIKEVLDVMTDVAHEGMTMLCVTHEMNFARTIADRIIFMDEGKILEQGKPQQFFSAPQTERARVFLSQILTR